ncbi:hypothetical protein D9756_005832 [Leucocoprinus leucothites]|uniref:Uncharacterized protein n=1 Tax=Leucocoprinus leucothites TaxID=201217 RepID=A0A8H5D4Q6_9AGAR|nr:hypothetical protein D9756_005832 [Leucoagaricus leucothites]
MAFRQRLVPLLVAAVTGVVSGVYIFKPLVAPQPKLEEVLASESAEPSKLANGTRANVIHDAKKPS